MLTLPRSRQPPPGVVVLDFRPFADAVRRVGAQLGQAFAALIKALVVGRPRAPAIPPHGFTPNYDLACGVCGLGPEECTGGRP